MLICKILSVICFIKFTKHPLLSKKGVHILEHGGDANE